MTKEEKVAAIEEAYGYPGFCVEMSDDAIDFYFDAARETDGCLYDADGWAWLNTLAGYKIPFRVAMEIENWLRDELGYDSLMEIESSSKGDVEAAVENLHLDVDLSGWRESKYVKYFWNN